VGEWTRMRVGLHFMLDTVKQMLRTYKVLKKGMEEGKWRHGGRNGERKRLKFIKYLTQSGGGRKIPTNAGDWKKIRGRRSMTIYDSNTKLHEKLEKGKKVPGKRVNISYGGGEGTKKVRETWRKRRRERKETVERITKIKFSCRCKAERGKIKLEQKSYWGHSPPL